jgi:hypothetical protein
MCVTRHLRAVVVAVVVALMLATSARGQKTVTLRIEYEHAVLQPGQSQTVRVWAFYEPGYGSLVPWTTPPGSGQLGFVSGLNDASLSVLSIANGETGAYSNLQINLHPLGSVGTPVAGGVQGIFVGQFEPILVSNPIWIWSATWTPFDYSPRSVTLATQATKPVGMFLQIGLGFPSRDEWMPIDTERSFQVVPAPGIIPLLAVVGLLAVRRRRGG